MRPKLLQELLPSRYLSFLLRESFQRFWPNGFPSYNFCLKILSFDDFEMGSFWVLAELNDRVKTSIVCL